MRNIINFDRRQFITGAGAALAASLAPVVANAQNSGPIRLGGIAPLTGGNSVDGPPTAKVMRGLVDEINAAGGINGRKLEIIVEDDQSNPEAGVRAVRTLIDVHKVVAVCCSGSSAVTMAIAPVCWESKVMLTTVSGADAITQLPHQGYILRTQPNTTFQAQRVSTYLLEKGAKRVAFASAPTPFAKTIYDAMVSILKPKGVETMSLIYDDKKPTFRSEVDEIIRFKPDAISFAGYLPDTVALLKDIYRARFLGMKVAYGFAFNQTVVDGVPPEVSEGVVAISPSAVVGSKAFEKVAKLTGMAVPTPYAAQIYDHINILALTLAASKQEPSGLLIHDTVRNVIQARNGEKADNFADGVKILASGKPLDYDGASGPCNFSSTGDITDARFRYEEVKGGKLTLVSIS
ncbi:amino acid/amide ABC transporter substrate-binding protein (HAAT family) [Bosea sp. AK1]|uniref:ABC transporter substrate-binding protein n=1 Tax=Bosea sp. AK1 TaxID=2587160 RepID=UPI00116CC4A0|nr:ABC transporter substrate-binding protein [Bosea sp. AK1]TQI65287.1 amino acid/amide ABC transporter substrate-binding protein (HAAT family) [Bosea sp. AK1]